MVDFSMDSEFQRDLDWVKQFVDEKVMPLEYLFDYDLDAPFDINNRPLRHVIERLQSEVKARGLWAMHLPAHLGGPGLGAVKLTYLNEILAKTYFASIIFGCQGPDSGNAEIVAMFGSEEQKVRYLKPLMDGKIFSTFAMTEPQGGSDPTNFKTTAVRDGTDWVINGDKWFASNGNHATFTIVCAQTDPMAAERHKRMTMFIVPTDTPGFEVVRHIGFFTDRPNAGGHPWLRYTNVRVPDSARLGPLHEGFMVAQSRLGGGRLHHAQRTIGFCQFMLDMMGERALSRWSHGALIADKQQVQFDIAKSHIELQQYRLLVLYTAWLFDQKKEHGREGRAAIAAVKAAMAKVAEDIALRCVHMHASIGLSNALHLGRWLAIALHEAVADGVTEVHLTHVAKHVLRRYKASPGPFPTEVIWERKAWAVPRVQPYLDEIGATIEDARGTRS
jgi:acyl-CoA dehydrogenase